MRQRKFIFILLIGLALCSGVAGQYQRRGDESKASKGRQVRMELPMDYAIFQSETAGKLRLEVYMQVFNPFLDFISEGSGYSASYTLEVAVYDKKKNQAGFESRDKSVKVESKDKTKSLVDFRTSQYNFDLEPGKYELILTLKNKNTKRVLTRSKKLKLKLKDYVDKHPRLSEIEFVQAASAGTEKLGSFAKGNLQVIPSVTRTFGGVEDNNRVIYYLELYQGTEPVDSVKMISLLRHNRRGKLSYRDSLTVAMDQNTIRQIRDISLDDLPPGEYKLEVTLLGRRNKKLDKKEASFRVAMTPEAALKHDYKTLVKQLAYIAEKDEADSLLELETLGDKKNGFREFWKRRDPTPGSAENEYKQEFYRRVRHANRTFAYMRRDGWQTDRGRIYIVFGHPDQLEDWPYSPNSPPYQEWHYYRDGRYKRFLFVDENEDGEYRLAFPYDGLYQRPGF